MNSGYSFCVMKSLTARWQCYGPFSFTLQQNVKQNKKKTKTNKLLACPSTMGNVGIVIKKWESDGNICEDTVKTGSCFSLLVQNQRMS